MLKKKWKGFSWIEIASVVVLFSAVLLLTLPSFSRFECQAKQSEAKFELMRILAAAQLFKAEYSRYPKLDELLDTDRVKLRQKNYSYEIIAAEDGSSFYVSALGKGQVKDDHWRVDPTRKLENLSDSCLR